MNDSLSNTLNLFRGRGVLVLGDAMLDTYLDGQCDRLCPEGPVPVVARGRRRAAAGGAANAAVNARALEARVRFLSVAGADARAARLGRLLERAGVPAGDLLVAPGRRTLAKTRITAGGQLLLRLDEGSTEEVPPACERDLIDRLGRLWPDSEAVLVSDYGYGVLTGRVIQALGELQRRDPRVLVVDSKRLAAFRDAGVTAVKPNYAEAVRQFGLPEAAGPARVALAAARGEAVLRATGARVAAVTLDADGAVVLERDRPPVRTRARPRPHCRAAGAGDTYAAALALALAAGADTPEAAELAAAAAAVVVARDGTSACGLSELRRRLAGGRKVAADLAELTARLEEHRRRGRRIVFTNGCFDILHSGHVGYLARARELGDVLVVGVNSDAGVRRLKGPERPVNCLEDRLAVLAALGCVDHLIAFEEDTPHALIRAVRPAVFVKGGDYTRDRLPEASLVEQLGGKVVILPLAAGRSTTGLIRRLRVHHAEPPRPGLAVLPSPDGVAGR
jgi:D-beta-D-heptose 7-phosphate kinase/D-beta-D-heptose 1-phosphate adenosyltransferase